MEKDDLPAGWGRTVLSTFWHWFDAAPVSDGAGRRPRHSVCRVMTRYEGDTIPTIARWEIDPSVCEMCRDILRARESGRLPSWMPMRTVAVVPAGLPDRIRAFFRQASESHPESPPFHETLAAFRAEGVTRQFLVALLRYDALRAGRPQRQPVRWGELTLDDVREVSGIERVRLEREPAQDFAPPDGEAAVR